MGRFEGLYLDDGSLFQWLGLDEKGRPCTALGVDLPGPGMMAEIVWRHGKSPDYQVATYAEVCHEWVRVDAMQSSKGLGAASAVFRDSAHLYFDPPSLYLWCTKKAAVFEAALRRTIPNWDDRPACAQLARLRTEWADGVTAWPKLDAAIAAGNWATAKAECLPRDLATQTRAYRQSYAAVESFYSLAAMYPPDVLPTPLPDGAGTV
jgi:hypothetical protein